MTVQTGSLTLTNPAGDSWDSHAELDSIRTALDRQAILAVTNRGGRVLEVNDRFCQISKYSREELVGRPHNIVNSGHHPPEFFAEMWQTISSGNSWRGDIRNRAKDGTHYWVDTTIAPRFGPNGKVIGYVSIRYDITARKEAEAALVEAYRKREQAALLLRDIIDTLPNGVAAYGPDDRLVLCNATHREFYNPTPPPQTLVGNAGCDEGTCCPDGVDLPACAAGGLTGRHGWALIPGGNAGSSGHANPEHAERREDHRHATEERRGAERENARRNKDRQWIVQHTDRRWLQVQERASHSGNLVRVSTDVTDIKQAEHRIAEQAQRDPLTGLFNRRIILEGMEELCTTLQPGDALTNSRPTQIAALLAIDLDGFKEINDRLGHDAGDQLLIEIARILGRAVRHSDIVARLGGDEFSILLRNLGREGDAIAVVDKLFQALEHPIRLGNKSIVPKASIGVAYFPRHGETPQDLMKHADMALYQAKAAGKRTFTIYHPRLGEAYQTRQQLAKALRNALQRKRIDVALQPQFSFANGSHVGFEALLRWTYRRRLMSPSEIISIAEEFGLIVALGYDVIARALGKMRRMLDLGLDPGMVAINASPTQLREGDFADRLGAMVRQHGLEPSQIEIEITESVILDQSSDLILATLEDLERLGIRMSLDDFGTGFASLTHLKRLPIHRLKIDHSFVRGVDQCPRDSAIVRTIISLSHSLDLEVVAEGIETEGQYRALSNMGCDFAQGFLIQVPLMGEELTRYLSEYNASRDGFSKLYDLRLARR